MSSFVCIFSRGREREIERERERKKKEPNAKRSTKRQYLPQMDRLVPTPSVFFTTKLWKDHERSIIVLWVTHNCSMGNSQFFYG